MLAAVPGLHAAAAPANSVAAGPGVLGWHVSLRSGFDLVCARMEAQGTKTRLYLNANTNDFVDVAAADVMATEMVELPLDVPPAAAVSPGRVAPATQPALRAHVDVAPLAASSASAAVIDADLIASIVHAESAGNPRAVSRTGARGLMQLMPGTAGQIGVADAFNPGKNVDGGTAYFEWLLERYHDNLEKALAAYNAGPGAVDKYHGIPPYRETQAYVRRVIQEFNRRKALAKQGAPTEEAVLQAAMLAQK